MVALSTSSVAAVCSLNTMKPVDTADDPSPSDRMFQANFPGAGHYDYYTHFTIVAVVRPSSQNLWMECPKCDLWVRGGHRPRLPAHPKTATYILGWMFSAHCFKNGSRHSAFLPWPADSSTCSRVTTCRPGDALWDERHWHPGPGEATIRLRSSNNTLPPIH